MKKPNRKILSFYQRKYDKIHKKQIRAARTRRGRRLCPSAKTKAKALRNSQKSTLRTAQKEFRENFYQRRPYLGQPRRVSIVGDLGLELKERVDYFLQFASGVIDSDARSITFDLKECTRLWPTGITLLCSLQQWVELTALSQQSPRLSSTTPASKSVHSYLSHSGFYKYVGRPSQAVPRFYGNKEIVKIRRETQFEQIEKREQEIVTLLRKRSALNEDAIDWFYSVVLIEIFANVTEHGISYRDNGYWVLAQYHPRTEIISISIADNGIGIRNSLSIGPQKDQILSVVDNSSENEGEFIRLAMQENVSGANDASLKDRRFWGAKYTSGSRRGNGLKRIADICKKLGIRLTILSHYGILILDEAGKVEKCQSMSNRIFAGTLYHITVQAKTRKRG